MIKTKLVLIALFMGMTGATCTFAQVDNSDARKERIKANLIHLFPQLEQHTVDVQDITPTDIEGLEKGRFIVDGQQQQPFLTNADDSQFYLLAGGPFDVSLTSEEIAEARREQEEAEAQKAREVHAALGPAVAGMPRRGPSEAPIMIIEFSDFQCPYCARANGTLDQLLTQNSEDVQLVYVQFPLESIHPWARAASIASICAANQSEEAFWTLHDSYFENQGEIDTSNVVDRSKTYLADSSIDMDAWMSCASEEDSESYQAASAAVDAALQLGIEHGVNSTPGFFINGHFVSGAQPLQTFEAVLEKAREGL